MLTQHKHVASDFCYDLALILGPAVLQDVLDNVIPILILGGDITKGENCTRSIPSKLIPKVYPEFKSSMKI